MKLFIGTILMYALLWTVTVYGALPNITDGVLIMYKLTPEQAAMFSATDGKLSCFWSEWDNQNSGGLSRDYLIMGSDNATYAWNRCATSPFAGADDAAMEMRAAYTDAALYFWCKVTDNNWVDYSGWPTDVVDIYVDAMDAAGIQDPMNWFNPTQWALTFSSKQIQVGMGSTTPITGYNYRFYDDLAMSIIDHAATFGEATYENMTMELKSMGTNVKIQEWMVPIGQVSPVGGTTQGTSIGFTGGYNDVDNDAPDCPNSLRFVGLCDPYCEPPNPAVWGAAEFGPPIGGSNVDDCIIHAVNPPGLKDISFISRSPVVVKTEFFTIHGERLAPSAGHSSNAFYIQRAVLTSGKISIEKVGICSR